MTDQKKEKPVKKCTEQGCENVLTKEYTTICNECLERARASLFHRCQIDKKEDNKNVR